MAGVDVGGASRRSSNVDLNMIPFVDLLMVVLAFLLVTAVWSSWASVHANAEAPGAVEGPITPTTPERTLHVFVGAESIRLVWKQAAVVLSETEVPRPPRGAAESRFDALAKQASAEWAEKGSHRDPSDPARDRAVLHIDDRAPYGEIAAAIDALSATKREARLGGAGREVPSFDVTFASR